MKLREKFQAIFAAASFAEVGEWDTAREILKKIKDKREVKRDRKRTAQRRRPRPRAYRA